MKVGKLVGYYFVWHYGPAFLDMLGVFQNILWFLYNFFSIPILLSTLIAPFERIQETYAGGLDPQGFLESLVFNLIMRVIGFIMRSVVIVVGIVVLLGAVVLELVMFVLWVFLPIVIISLFLAGFSFF
jgi:hypothetical protein